MNTEEQAVRRAGEMKGAHNVEPELRPGTSRIEAFSDAVFAIAVTIMVIEIRIPAVLAFGDDRAALMEFAAILATYALSFVVVGIFWANHHYLMFTLPRADRATLWLNTNFVFWITLIPIVAPFLGKHPMAPRAAAAYAFIILACTVSLSMLRVHAVQVSQNALHRTIHFRVFGKAIIATTLYAAAIPLAFVNMDLVWALFVILPAIFFLPVIRRPKELHWMIGT